MPLIRSLVGSLGLGALAAGCTPANQLQGSVGELTSLVFSQVVVTQSTASKTSPAQFVVSYRNAEDDAGAYSIPFELAVNTQQQLVVQRGSTLSVPQDVVVAAAQPGIYTQDQSGTGAGVIVNGLSNALITPSSPAKAGDVIVMYCNGLGAVNPAVPSGKPAPIGGPLSQTVNPATLTIGGIAARVDFAGLTPGYPDLYQVNTVVPAGVTPGTDVPVVLTIAGQSSPPVTIAVQ